MSSSLFISYLGWQVTRGRMQAMDDVRFIYNIYSRLNQDGFSVTGKNR